MSNRPVLVRWFVVPVVVSGALCVLGLAGCERRREIALTPLPEDLRIEVSGGSVFGYLEIEVEPDGRGQIERSSGPGEDSLETFQLDRNQRTEIWHAIERNRFFSLAPDYPGHFVNLISCDGGSLCLLVRARGDSNSVRVENDAIPAVDDINHVINDVMDGRSPGNRPVDWSVQTARVTRARPWLLATWRDACDAARWEWERRVASANGSLPAPATPRPGWRHVGDMAYREDTMVVTVHPRKANRGGRAGPLEIDVALPLEPRRYDVGATIRAGSRVIHGRVLEIAGHVVERTRVHLAFEAGDSSGAWPAGPWVLSVQAMPRPPRDPRGAWYPSRHWEWPPLNARPVAAVR